MPPTIGDTFHQLTIIEILPRSDKYRRVLVRCECGVEKDVRYDHVRVRSKPKKVKWKCKCDCGNTCFVVLKDLTSGNTS